MGTLLEGRKIVDRESLGDTKERDRIRVTLDLTPSMKAILDQLAESLFAAAHLFFGAAAASYIDHHALPN